MAYIRQFKTGSGATGVQVCYKEHGRVVKTVHIGSAVSEDHLNRLLKRARALIDRGQVSLFDLTKFDK